MLFLLVTALTFMWRNVYSINKMLNNPVDTRPRSRHPEMQNVKFGDELLVAKFDDDFEDPMYKTLGDRINELEELEDDDEDDGDIVVRI